MDYMITTRAEHGQNIFCACSFPGNSMYNLLSYCGLIDAKIRASEKDLRVNLFQKLATSGENVVYQNCSECQNKTKQQFVYTTCSAGILSLQCS